MANDNCLDGMRCPSCGSEEPFRIEVVRMIDVWDSGTEESKFTNTEWGNDSYSECMTCDWTGQAKDLYVVNSSNEPSER